MAKNHTKNKYKDQIKDMNYDELITEYNKLSLLSIRGNHVASTGSNPYKEHYDMKMIKYKKALITQKLLTVSK